VLYRCIAHEGPFTAPDVLAVLNNLATRTPQRLRGTPRALGDLVDRLLSKDAAARPSSAAEVERALEALLATDLQPDSTPAVADPTLQSLQPSRLRRYRDKALIVGIVAVLLGAVGSLAYWRTRPPPTTTRAPAVRAVAEHACRTWGSELARRQKSDGSFTGESHRDPTGWDTAQELVALEQAKACSAISPLTLRSAADALVAMRQPAGWSGPDRTSGTTISAASNAWAALALAHVARDDTHEHDAADASRRLLLSSQRPDGAFGYKGPADAPDTYTTLIATWALAAGDSIDTSAEVRTARHNALAWLRGAFRASSELRGVAGFEEQFLWVLAGVHRALPTEAGDDDVFRTGASDLIARCGLDQATHACTRPVYDDGEIDIGTGKLVTLWHAWVGAAADALASGPVALAPDVREDLEAIARWAATTIEASIDALAALPEYKLAEYLIAASGLAASR
jgi:hypothetical protein